MQTLSAKARLQSVDFLRGLAMILMVLDHTRDFFSNFPFDPTDLQHTSAALFFTRWVTYFSAPIFLLLVGLSMSLASQQGKSKKELCLFLITRGIWMIIADQTLVNFVWHFSFIPKVYEVGIFTIIGVSMMLLGCSLFLPTWLLLLISLLVIGGHNWLDGREPELLKGLAWLHVRGVYDFSLPAHISVFVGYPFIPWLVVPMLGYVIGGSYTLTVKERKAWFYILGLAITVFFILLRLSNVYGEPNLWSDQKNALFNFLSFLNCSKYPPSLLFLAMIFGPTLMLLASFENANNDVVRLVATYGKVPFFFYLGHIFLLHIFAICNVYFQSGSTEGLFGDSIIMGKTALRYGYHLPMVYMAWLFTLLLLFPLCKYYGNYKRRHRDWWWLSYF